MSSRVFPALAFLTYIVFLLVVMVFKAVPAIETSGVVLDFGGTNGENPANFVPFATILPYLLGEKGILIGGLNLVGNIVLLIPVGFLVPLLSAKVSGKRTLFLSIASGLLIELLQVVLGVGIFDIDDVLLNALGFLLGLGTFVLLSQARVSRKARGVLLLVSVLTGIMLAGGAFVVYRDLQSSAHLKEQRVSSVQQPLGKEGENPRPQANDLCKGTGGNGRIVSIEETKLVIERKDGTLQDVYFADQLRVKTSSGDASRSDLKQGDRVTLVGDAHPDGSFTAEVLFVCSQE